MARKSQPAHQRFWASLVTILKQAIQVVIAPRTFYRKMPRRGGYLPPTLFVLIVSGLPLFLPVVWKSFSFMTEGAPASVLLPAFGWGFVFSLLGLPLSVLGAGVCFFLWKLLGSAQSFETTFRCVAYISVLVPFAVLAEHVPLGWLGIVIWGLSLLVIASVKVHQLKSRDAWLVFGAFGLVWVVSVLHRDMR